MTLLQHQIPGGAAWSVAVRAGRSVTLTARGPDAMLSMLIFGPDQLDRLNVPDTLKAQMSARIKPPMVLMSDRGLALASVTGSSLDWHDALTGVGQSTHLDRFGPSSYQADRNDWHRSAHTGLISELTKNGLGEADLHGTVNFFTKIAISDDGRATLAFVAGHCVTGDWVTLRTEQDLLLVMASGQHSMNPSTAYSPSGVSVDIDVAAPVAPDDPSILFRDESARALEQTRLVRI